MFILYIYSMIQTTIRIPLYEYEILCNEAKKKNRYPSEMLRVLILNNKSTLDDNLFTNLPSTTNKPSKKLNMQMPVSGKEKLFKLKESTQRTINSICRVLIRNLHE